MIRPFSLRLARTLVVLGVVAASWGCAYLPTDARPEILGVTPKITGIDLQGVNMAFDLNVRNPYPVAIKSPKFKYSFAVEGTPLATEQIAEGFNLPARKTGIATLPVRVGYQDLFNIMGGLRGANKANYKIDGAFLIDALGEAFELPFGHEGIMPILQPPDFSAVSMKQPEVSLSGAKVAVDANVTNPNIFAIGFKNLGYTMQIGDIPVGDLAISTLEQLAAESSGRMSFGGQVSAWDAARGVLSGGKLGEIKIMPRGEIETPYGPVKLDGKLIQSLRGPAN
jgi:LEA14-like dessication related protein